MMFARRTAALAALSLLSTACQEALPTPETARTLFEKDPLLIERAPASPARIARGRERFHERGSAQSCSSCHRDDTPRSDGAAPTLFDSARLYLLGAHGEHKSLEGAIRACVARDRLGLDDAAIDALAAYVATLRTRGRWDAFLAGRTHALTGEERAGLRDFVRVGCAACHGNRLLGGRSTHVIPGAGTSARRAPPLAHAAKTAPYFHDASASSLEDAIRSMAQRVLQKTLRDEQVARIAKFLNAVADVELGARPARETMARQSKRR